MMEIFNGVDNKDMLFIDIETVRLKNEFDDLDDAYKQSFEYKVRYAREAVEKFGIEDVRELWKEKSALWSEFAKIVCISLGYIGSNNFLKIKSYASHDEEKLLTDFMIDLNLFHRNNPKIKLVGHAITGFDIPMIMRRCIVNRVHMNSLIDCSNKKPWEIPLIDTLLAWKASGYYSASLINVAVANGVPTSKNDIDGSQVGDVYWENDDLDRIVRYCEADVLCTANVARAFRYERPVELEPDSNIEVEKIPLLHRIYSSQAISLDDATEIKNYMYENGFSKEDRQKTLNIVKSAVKGGRIDKEIQKLFA